MAQKKRIPFLCIKFQVQLPQVHRLLLRLPHSAGLQGLGGEPGEGGGNRQDGRSGDVTAVVTVVTVVTVVVTAVVCLKLFPKFSQVVAG